jgi:hypothetical protein
VPHIIEAQVDWLTVTARDSADLGALAVLGTSLAHQEAENGNRLSEWRWMGYLGWHAGRASVGTGPQGSILRLSGDLADQAFREATTACDHVSRVDLAATVRLDCADWRYEARRWEEYRAWMKEHDLRASGTYMEDTHGGGTCYVGSRASQAYLRIYNKGIESKCHRDPAEIARYENCHRYELELKNERACAASAALSDVPDRAPAVLGWLAGCCHQHGISSQDLGPERIDLLPGFRRRTDTDTRLGWLSTQVAPSLRWLVDRGHTEAVLGVLGLDAIAEPQHAQGVWRRPKGV